MDRPLSIIILSNDDSLTLKDTIPVLLSQEYGPGYEVIVVRETRRGDVRDILKPLMENHANLRSTYLPDKPKYVSDDEIKIMLGVKAAEYDDIIMIPPYYMPQSAEWLKDIAESTEITDETPLHLGDAHIVGKLGFFKRRRHGKTVRRALKPWCKTKGIRRKALRLGKETRHDVSIAFSRKDYLADMRLRNIISSHIML
ncbi:MAG: hypothetical protein ACI3Y5_06155 [Prevotella sp.]